MSLPAELEQKLTREVAYFCKTHYPQEPRFLYLGHAEYDAYMTAACFAAAGFAAESVIRGEAPAFMGAKVLHVVTPTHIACS